MRGPRGCPRPGAPRRRKRAAGLKKVPLDSYDIDEDMVDAVRVGDEALLQLGFDWLRNVMFNEPILAPKPEVLQRAIGKAREGLGGS